MSRLLDILGCRYPIIQGPIGATNSPEMVAAISEAGAFGMLAMGFIADAEEAKRLVKEVRELTDKPFGANLMTMNPSNGAILEVLAESGVKTVTTSAGSPRNLYPIIHEMGMKGLHVVLALSYAVKAEDAGADGIVISGSESGGLRSIKQESSNMILIPMAADNLKVPVVAAGGIADSRGYRAALALGAEGVQVGTRFLASEESPAPKAWKEAILNCTDGNTALLPLGNMMMRVIVNPKLKEQMSDPKTDFLKEYNLMNAPEAWGTGNFDIFPAGGGQISALIHEIKPVREIIEEMVS
ncbi:MAG: nitronate monooxygenase [Thermodesulfobacteriota bacterium]|nr:nitronate monooxygenase [Thermodesulfobacteriota bacterium]